jgi:hypothetical protein
MNALRAFSAFFGLLILIGFTTFLVLGGRHDAGTAAARSAAATALVEAQPAEQERPTVDSTEIDAPHLLPVSPQATQAGSSSHASSPAHKAAKPAGSGYPRLGMTMSGKLGLKVGPGLVLTHKGLHFGF